MTNLALCPDSILCFLRIHRAPIFPVYVISWQEVKKRPQLCFFLTFPAPAAAAAATAATAAAPYPSSQMFATDTSSMIQEGKNVVKRRRL